MKISRVVRSAAIVVLLAVGGSASAAERGFYLGAGWLNIDADYQGDDQRVYPAIVGPPLSAGMIRESAAAGAWNAFPMEDRGYKVMAGYRALDWLAFELEYADLGGNSNAIFIDCVDAPCPDRATSESKVLTGSALGLFSIGKFDLFGRIGLASDRTRYSLHDGGDPYFSHDENETVTVYGAGVQLALGHVLTRLELQRLQVGGYDADIASLGFAYAF